MSLTSTDDGAVEARFLHPDTYANPYRLAHHLRTSDPVHWSAELGAWVLTRYEDAMTVLHDPRITSERIPDLDRLSDMGVEQLRPLMASFREMLIFREAPDHGRLKALATRAFTKPNVEAWRDTAQRITDTLLDRASEKGVIDVIGELAQPLPIAVSTEVVLGLPEEMLPSIKAWSDDIVPFFANLSLNGLQLARAQRAMIAFSGFLRQTIDERRRRPEARPDLFSSLVAVLDDALTEEELIANAILLVGAGHVTTTDLIGSGTLSLLRHPEQAQKVVETSTTSRFMESAVEELLRYESPVQIVSRIARSDFEIGGTVIGRGSSVLTWLSAANRDPARFPDPDALDLLRPDNRHLAFAAGGHYCLGAPLARMQGQVALRTLFRRFPEMRLQEGAVEWKPTIMMRGLKTLPVSLA